MTITYTLNMPSSDPSLNRRLGFKTPRSILLPPYLALNGYFVDYTNSMDAVFGPTIDEKIDIIANIRNMWVTNPDLENNVIAESQMVPFDGWSQPEREILVKQVNLLGMKLATASVLSNDAYQTIARFVGQYWFGKGTGAFIEFINFCLSTGLTVTRMWTQDYINFLPEGDGGIGTPIWEGGAWYPTTHVQLVSIDGLPNVDLLTLVSFFYEIANYNLVLYGVDVTYNLPIVDRIRVGKTTAKVVAMALWTENSFPISNLYQFGANPPSSYSLAPDFPMNALTTAPVQSDYTQVIMLCAPSAWMEDADGNTIPVYTPEDQVIVNSALTSSTVTGNVSTDGEIAGVNTLIGPFTWGAIPGSPDSQARIPMFSMVPGLRTSYIDYIPSQKVGNVALSPLVNPKGFKEFVVGSGQFYPYF